MAVQRNKSASMRSAERTLEVLRALNEHNRSRVSELHAVTRIPRPSLYRILETLCALGYVRKRSDEGYDVTERVRLLASGFQEEAWVRQTAYPVMQALQHEIVWPTDLSVLEGEAMVLAETTRRASPLTIDGFRVGARLPLLRTAAGRAYLAWCPVPERRAILERLERSSPREHATDRERRSVAQAIAQTRRNGYGQQHGEIDKKIAAIAVPILSDGRVLACLGITVITSALTCAEAARRYLAPLKAAAREIEGLVPSPHRGTTPA